MKHLALMAAAASFALIAGAGSAFADDCSGRDHTAGTVLGAGGGALIGGLATNSVAGAVVGGVVGGFAGNAIARSNDCERQDEGNARYEDRNRQQVYDNQQTYDDQQRQQAYDSQPAYNNEQRQQAYGSPRSLVNQQRQQAYDAQQQADTQPQSYDQTHSPQPYDDRGRQQFDNRGQSYYRNDGQTRPDDELAIERDQTTSFLIDPSLFPFGHAGISICQEYNTDEYNSDYRSFGFTFGRRRFLGARPLLVDSSPPELTVTICVSSRRGRALSKPCSPAS